MLQITDKILDKLPETRAQNATLIKNYAASSMLDKTRN